MVIARSTGIVQDAFMPIYILTVKKYYILEKRTAPPLGATVKERWSANDKEGLWKYLNKNGVKEHIPIIGFVFLPEQKRFSSELLKDIESLLIFSEQPAGNINNKKTRGISRPGMIIKCSGKIWPGKKFYEDEQNDLNLQ